MRITYLGHASVLIEIDGVKVMTDPLLRPRVLRVLRRVVPPATREQLTGVDLVLLSHAHHDHLDPPSLRMLDGTPRVVCPEPARGGVDAAGLSGEVLAEGESLAAGGIVIEAVHAEHDGRRMPWSRDGQALGYVLRGRSGSVYFAGDTGIYDGMADLGDLDAALLPVSGWGPRLPAGHMGPDEAAAAVELIEPRVAIPIHWGAYERLAMRGGGDGDRRARRFCDQVGRLSAPVRAELLAPGTALEIPAGAAGTASSA
jgi:L-ascorbate metabolism protein UlaG (beta-lactamase superfamily)